jgi:hypothetical protein
LDDNDGIEGPVEQKSQVQIDLENGLLPLRFVTAISTRTNLRCMNLGDEAIKKLSEALHGDGLITSVCLAHARFSCLGVSYLADAIITMNALTYLDLSCNLIADDGAFLLAGCLNSCCAYIPPEGTGIEASHNTAGYINKNQDESVDFRPIPLKKLSLAGNRITFAGAKALLEMAFQSSGCLEFIR